MTETDTVTDIQSPKIDMPEDWKSSEINELSKALSKAQKEIRGAKSDSKNPFFNSSYADLHTVMETA